MINDIKAALAGGREGLNLLDPVLVGEWLSALVEVFDAAKLTLEANAHLADGDHCNLKTLRDAVNKLEGK